MVDTKADLIQSSTFALDILPLAASYILVEAPILQRYSYDRSDVDRAPPFLVDVQL